MLVRRGPPSVTRAIGEVRPLLAERDAPSASASGCGPRPRPVDRLGASGRTGIIDGTEIRVRRLRGHHHAHRLGLARLLADGPPAEILADAGYQGLGAQTGGRVVTPPHRKFKKNTPDWFEEIHEQRRKAHSSRRIPVEHGIAHTKNWRSLTRHLGRREHVSDMVQAVASLLSHQQMTDLASARRT
ncbi:transposase family protein [Yinghuangia sp. ASG 101]|uniref:transposase family protein n=1 Tax=Yinghuangia sp. ASG 101 TaxID=2896848 RepID=UPI001E3DFFF5|nr:transposase family protein [Yinghuangia sp. ASG 101]UGQ12054.1 transposase family protein [Yinghuangia sp. ASG 101]